MAGDLLKGELTGSATESDVASQAAARMQMQSLLKAA